MRIGLQTWGTDGDILPFIALAKGLKDAGHVVSLAYTSIDGKSYEVEGIGMIEANEAVGFNPPPNPYSMGKKPGSFGEYTALIENYFDPFSESMYQASEALCKNNDLVVGHSICHTLLTASELHNCPRVALALAPMVVRSDSVSPTGESFGRLVNASMWSIGDAVSTRTWFKEGVRIRKNAGLKPIKSLQSELFTSDLLTLVACSPSLVKRPNDWKENVQMTGFLQVGEVTRKPPSTELIRFLENGDPPVYMTFGSCMQYHSKMFTDLLVNAAIESGKRTIVQTDHPHPEFERRPDLLRVDRAPHGEIFPHCDLVVHHGGAGTTQAVLYAGKPSVVVAHGFDQKYWSEELCRSRLGGIPLAINSVEVRSISDQVISVSSNPDLKRRSSEIRQHLIEEDGLQQSVIRISALRV